MNIQELITKNSQILRDAIQIEDTKEIKINAFWGIPLCTVELIQPSGTHLFRIDVTNKSFNLVSAHAENRESTIIAGEIILYIVNVVLETVEKMPEMIPSVGETD